MNIRILENLKLLLQRKKGVFYAGSMIITAVGKI